MNIEIPLFLFSGVSAIFLTFFSWLAHRTIAHQGQIKHLDEKMDLGFKRIEDKLDAAIQHMDQKMDRQDHEAKERISRLEKYFDVIMQTQIKKSNDQLKMEI